MSDIDNWADARYQFHHVILPRLQKHGKAIGADTENPKAKEIIKYYSMLSRSFDPMSFHLLSKAMEDYGIKE